MAEPTPPLIRIDTEFVIGLVTPIGTDGTTVIQALSDELRRYNYYPIVIKVSDDVMPLLSPASSIAGMPEYDRIKHYINLGDELRKQFGRNDILSLGVVAKIDLEREKAASNKRTRLVYLVNSLKRSEEVQLLRSVYGDGFYLWGVYTERERRLTQLVKHKEMSQEHAEELIRIDENEKSPFGQKTRETFHLSDFFLYDIGLDRLRGDIDRFMRLIFAHPFTTPTFDEYAMFLAFAASLRSADLSRQVGAVLTQNNEILATGANEVPRFGGGQYWAHYNDTETEVVDDNLGRDYMRSIDSNTAEKNAIINEILEKLEICEDRRFKSEEELRESKIWDITEYGRSVHAEMEALLACARRGIASRGCTLYTTTYPCHNCAKHIVNSGITRVLYIEPYPKSKAIELHNDSISESKQKDHVHFLPFVGVGPRKFFDLFSMTLSSGRKIARKNTDGRLFEVRLKSQSEIRLPLDRKSCIARETLIISDLKELIQNRPGAKQWQTIPLRRKKTTKRFLLGSTRKLAKLLTGAKRTKGTTNPPSHRTMYQNTIPPMTNEQGKVTEDPHTTKRGD